MTFSDLGLIKELCSVCQRMKWDSPTKIQVNSIPFALEGKDIVGIAETGSGKTGAFLLPIIQHWIKFGQPVGFALILAPTRELAQQLANEAERLGQYKTDELEFHLEVILLVGGEDMVDQALKLAWRKHHFIVDMKSNNKMIKLITTKYPHPQIYLYSATMTKDVNKLRRAALSSNAVFINENDDTIHNNEGNPKNDDKNTMGCNLIQQQQSNSTLKLNKHLKTGFPIGLSHYCLPIRLADRPTILNWVVENVIQTNLLEKFGITSFTPSQKHHIMIFCKRCHETIMVAEFLRESGHSSVALTGRMKQIDRKESLNKFISSEVEVLVATDVASRGLDIPHVEFVINYNVPLSEKSYRHRVGRTARAGQTGVALTLVTRDVAQSFLELEAALLPYLPLSTANNGNNSPGIPRWPIPLPDLHGRNGLLTRRRLADQAWSRASKTIRSQLESHRNVDNNLTDLDPMINEELIETYANSDEDDNSSMSSSSSLSNDESKINELSTISKKHYPPTILLDTSGQAGINAARKTWKSLAKMQRLQQKAKIELEEQQRLTKSIGWGVTSTRNMLNNNDIIDRFNNEIDNDDDDGDEQEMTRFEQPIKTKYAKIQLLKKMDRLKSR
ncbi:unnamed protein product [Schistosoma rodhaini]|nr:unnamed protein product [Schistosoma rodhaini]